MPYGDDGEHEGCPRGLKSKDVSNEFERHTQQCRRLTLLVLPLELLGEVHDKTVVKVLTTQVSVTGGCLDLEDTLLDGQKGHIEGSSTEIEDQDVTLASGLLVKAVSDGSSRGLVDDTENVEASDGASILCGLTL